MGPSPTPGQQLTPPGADQPQASPGTGASFPSPAPAVPDPNEMGKRFVTDLLAAARRVGVKYPTLVPEVREITQNLVPKMLQKLVQSQPAPEPAAPPM